MNPQQKPDDPIKHVVLLMFENHSFDQMLGCFPSVEGNNPANPGVNKDDKNKEFKQKPNRWRQMILDPHHEVNHVETQLKDNNSGFVLTSCCPILSQRQLTNSETVNSGYYRRGFLPTLHTLAIRN